MEALSLSSIAIFAVLAISVLALSAALLLHPSRSFYSSEISFEVADIDSEIKQQFVLGANSNYPSTRTEWVAKLTLEAIARMLELYPSVDVHRLSVFIHSARFHNSAK